MNGKQQRCAHLALLVTLLVSGRVFAEDTLALRTAALDKYLLTCDLLPALSVFRDADKNKTFGAPNSTGASVQSCDNNCLDGIQHGFERAYRIVLPEVFTVNEISSMSDICEVVGGKIGRLVKTVMTNTSSEVAKLRNAPATLTMKKYRAEVPFTPAMWRYMYASAKGELAQASMFGKQELLSSDEMDAMVAVSAHALYSAARNVFTVTEYEAWIAAINTPSSLSAMEKLAAVTPHVISVAMIEIERSAQEGWRNYYRAAAASLDIQGSAPPPDSHGLVPARLPDNFKLNDSCSYYYPAEARAAGEVGSTVVGFTVGEDGWVNAARIERSSGSYRLDDATSLCLRETARYYPEYFDGKPQSSFKQLRYTWQLTTADVHQKAELANPVIASATLPLEAITTTPEIIQARVAKGAKLDCVSFLPRESQARREVGSVVLLVFIAPNGKVSETKVETSSGSQRLDEAAATCVTTQGRFEPTKVGTESIGSWQRMKWTWAYR